MDHNQNIDLMHGSNEKAHSILEIIRKGFKNKTPSIVMPLHRSLVCICGIWCRVLLFTVSQKRYCGARQRVEKCSPNDQEVQALSL